MQNHSVIEYHCFMSSFTPLVTVASKKQKKMSTLILRIMIVMMRVASGVLPFYSFRLPEFYWIVLQADADTSDVA